MKSIYACVLVFIVSFLSFTQSLRYFPTTDSLPNNFVAMNLIFENRIDLTNYKHLFIDSGLLGIYVENDKGVVFSKSPPIVGLLSVPPFILVNSYFGINHLSVDQVFSSPYNQYAGKVSASIYTSLSAAFVFLILKEFSKNNKIPFLATAVYVFCTNVFNTAAQANTMHGLSLFLTMLFVWIIVSAKQRLLPYLVAGLIAGIFTQVRVSNVLYMFFPIALVLAKTGISKELIKKTVLLCLGFILSYGFIQMWYISLDVPYGVQSEIFYSIETWNIDKFWRNAVSILFSFNFGLFFYSPILLLSCLGIIKIVKKGQDRSDEEIFLTALVPVAFLFLVFASSWWMWIGGGALNARMLSESVPVYVFLFGYIIKHLHGLFVKMFIVATFGLSIYMNFLTTYQLEGAWWSNLLVGEVMYNRNAWFSTPFLAQYMFENNYIYINSVYRRNNEIIEHIRVYRPSFYHRSIPKLFDEEKAILTLE